MFESNNYIPPSHREKIAIGTLSGTSLDGIDVGLFKIKGGGVKTKLNLIDFKTYSYPLAIKKFLLRNSHKNSSSVDEICRLNIILGKLFAESILKVIKKNNLKPENISFIGSHGQTIHHLPDNKKFAGYRVKSTLQIGDPSVIANLTGITTIGDFRVADCAMGGDGAPLVPYFDYILFSSKKINRGLLNIGGISNITVIPKGGEKNDIIAFDTGPGNMLIDGLTKSLFKQNFDKNGKLSEKGNVNRDVLGYLLKEKTYRNKPPKSTGREVYGLNFQKKLIRKFSNIKKHEIIRTVTEFTAYSIYYNYKNFIRDKVEIDELIISGGGAKNPLLIELIKDYFKGIKITQFKAWGMDADSKEAALFVVLANECLLGNSTNITSVTGSKKNVILGKICLVNN